MIRIQTIHDDEIKDNTSQDVVDSIYEDFEHKNLPKYISGAQILTKAIKMSDKTSTIYLNLVIENLIDLYESSWQSDYATLPQDV